jgi:phage-related protein
MAGISLDIVSKFSDAGIKAAESGLGSLGKIGQGFGVAIGASMAAAAAGVVAFAGASINAAAESEAVTRGLENAVKNAGAFGSTSAEIDKVTEAFDKASTTLAEYSGIDDEVVNGIKTAWLAVPAIAGMGLDGINNLAVTAADVAAGTGKDIEGVANAFSKAFENPEAALSKLERTGIFVTDSQKALYESMVANGDAAGAQAMLIDTLGATYAGAAEAAANPFDRLKVIFENLMETIGGALMPAIEKIVPLFAELIGGLAEDPAFQAFLDGLAEAFGLLMTAIEPLLPVLLDLITSLLPPIMTLFTALAPIIVKLVEAFAPLITMIFEALGPIIEGLLPIFMILIEDLIMPLIPIIMSLVEAFMPLIMAVLPLLTGLLEFLMPILVFVADIIGKVLVVAVNILTEAFKAIGPILQNVGNFFGTVFGGIADFFRGFINGLIGGFESFVNFFIDGLNMLIGPLNAVLDGLAFVTGGAIDLNIPEIARVSIPRLAEGGIVMPSPGGSLVNVAEAGQAEAIIPLDRIGGIGGGQTNHYSINVTAGVGDPQSIGQQIVAYIKRYEKASGPVFAGA